MALGALNRSDPSPGSLERYLNAAFLRVAGLDSRDRAFVVHLAQGVTRWRMRLDWIIAQNVRFPFERIEPAVLNILRLGLYQILFMDRVPDSAAVDEAVKQAKVAGRSRLAGFVNGLLRNLSRSKGRLCLPDRIQDPVQYLCITYSYPEWLVRLWLEDFGMEASERLLAAGNRMPELVLRVNRLRTVRGEILDRLADEGVSAKATSYSPEGIRVSRSRGFIDQWDVFRRGFVQVQGEAAQVCSHLIQPLPGERILDVCAGQGGKTTHLAELAGDRSDITALDIHPERLVRLRKASERLGVRMIQAVAADVSRPLPLRAEEEFDKILVDGPCSGLGLLSRHPDGKWARRKEDLLDLSKLQEAILHRVFPFLKRGGKLLYVTCTISKVENDGVVRDFLKRQPEVRLIDLSNHVPSWGKELIDRQGYFRALPHIHGMEGFFGALFTKEPR